MNKYIDAEKLIAEIERMKKEFYEAFFFSRGEEGAKKERLIESEIHARVKCVVCDKVIGIITSLQQEQPSLPTIKGWIARDDADRLGLYDQKPTRKTELGAFSGIVHSWVIGDTWIGRFSLDQTAKTLFPNLCWKNDPIEVELIIKPIQGQPEVNLEKEEFVGVAESPSKTFPRVNEFDCGGGYRH